MDRRFTIEFRASEIGPASKAEFPEFTADTLHLLSNFMAFSAEAHKTRFANELISYKPSFHLANSGMVRNAGVVPDDEALSTFLHKYRPIILHSEPTSFSNICSALVRHIKHPPFNQVVRGWQEEFSGKMLRELFTMKQGDILLTSQSFLNLYLNGFEYHRDERMRESLSAFASTFEPAARNGLVTLLLTLKFSAVSRLREFISELQRLRGP
jgi:hypothetical protein